jgi:4-hydroxy-3-methylbut-2-enyl diphosphate reductase
MQHLDVVLAAPRGFCAGVERAIATVRNAIQAHGAPVYVLHEIVHNKHVILELEEAGAIFVEELEEIPEGGLCIFSAHGVSRAVEEKAASLGLKTVDATCPLVSSVHRMVERYHRDELDVVIIGHHRHPEVEGTAGRVAGNVHVVAKADEVSALRVKDPEKVAYVTQTTLSRGDIEPIRDELRRRFPLVRGPKSNICFATENRQNAVRELANSADLIFVVGSRNSSNSNRLKEVARLAGTAAHLIDDHSDIDLAWLEGVKSLGITAGASAPERLVDGVIARLREVRNVQLKEMEGIEEEVHFKPAKID